MSFITIDEGSSRQSLNQLESAFMYTQLYKEVVLEMKYDEQSLKNFIAYCRNGNYGSSTNITRFENKYNPQLAIWWYTYPGFIYDLLNSALRKLEPNTILNMAFFVHDLHHQIKQLYQEQIMNHKEKVFTTYRGQGLSNIDFVKLQNAKDGLISFNNFFSY